MGTSAGSAKGVTMPMRPTVEASCSRLRRKKAAKSARFLSTSTVSLVSLLMMRPSGVVWKNAIGALCYRKHKTAESALLVAVTWRAYIPCCNSHGFNLTSRKARKVRENLECLSLQRGNLGWRPSAIFTKLASIKAHLSSCLSMELCRKRAAVRLSHFSRNWLISTKITCAEMASSETAILFTRVKKTSSRYNVAHIQP